MAEAWQRAEIPGPRRAAVISKPEKIPPCKDRCPIGNDIHEFLHLSKQGRFEEATEVLKKSNPLPAVCGRVCYHPCEEACKRKEYDESLGIRDVERFLGDFSLKKSGQKKNVHSNLPKVAVVGSGPSGLSCAYFLASLGYRVTIFEALPAVGGMLAIGIPDYRLPKEILQREVMGILETQGIELKKNHPVKDLNELNGYDAVFLGTGAIKSTKLGIPNEEAEGVYPGLEFLKAVNLGEKPTVGKKVLVIGGGNTAIDCARTCIRMGASVTVLYRRSRKEMPSSPEEVEDALAEGVEIQSLVAPKSVLTKDNKVTGIECVKMRLAEPDASGRRRPIPIEGSEFKIEGDTVIVAIGQAPDLSYLPAGIETERGFIKIDSFGQTSKPSVFAGGDAALGVTQRVADALVSGRRAALAIDSYLRGESPKSLEKPGVMEFWEINVDYYDLKPRVRMPCLSLEERKRGFEEINLGFDQGMAKTESMRCFHCGLGIYEEDIKLVAALINGAKNPVFIVGHEAAEIELGDGKKPIDYVIRIARSTEIPVVATAQVVAEFSKRGFKPAAWMSAMDIGNRLVDPKWGVFGQGPHDLAIFIGIPYGMEWLIHSGLKSFANHVKTLSLNRFYQPNTMWSFANLSLGDWRKYLEFIADEVERK